ncbi:ISNCY family transposase [Rhodopila sp.]|uniref:ISNCY family transposase n=1 Tax=Rhodopila sp. TaxID=2480087 RepID=UPI003D0EB976
MRRTEALQGVRVIKFRSEFERHEAGELNQIDAAALLGVNERTLRRWCVRFDDAGESGLLDRRLGQVSGQRVPSEREAQIETLYRTRYSGFTAKHFHEHLVRDHGFAWGYTWTKVFLQSNGLLPRATTRGAHRCKRPRRPLPGMMLHQDGSRHGWIGGLDAMDLIVTMDDATNTIYSAFVCPEEGTVSTFQALLQVFGEHGLPLSLYTDRGSHYFHTPRADGPVDRQSPTQVGRALAQLGVEHIAAYSPEARGRSERLFATLQDRLVKELALAGIGTVAAANDFIREVYMPAHNARFAVQAEQDGSAFVAISGVDLAEILCVQEDRQVGHDNTVVFHQLRLQIPPSPLRAHFVKATVKVRRYHDGSHAIFHGPRCLGRYDGHGALRAGALGAAA